MEAPTVLTLQLLRHCIIYYLVSRKTGYWVTIHFQEENKGFLFQLSESVLATNLERNKSNIHL